MALLKYDFFALLKLVRPQYIGEVGKFITVNFPNDAVYQKPLKSGVF